MAAAVAFVTTVATVTDKEPKPLSDAQAKKKLFDIGSLILKKGANIRSLKLVRHIPKYYKHRNPAKKRRFRFKWS